MGYLRSEYKRNIPYPEWKLLYRILQGVYVALLTEVIKHPWQDERDIVMYRWHTKPRKSRSDYARRDGIKKDKDACLRYATQSRALLEDCKLCIQRLREHDQAVDIELELMLIDCEEKIMGR